MPLCGESLSRMKVTTRKAELEHRELEVSDTMVS